MKELLQAKKSAWIQGIAEGPLVWLQVCKTSHLLDHLYPIGGHGEEGKDPSDRALLYQQAREAVFPMVDRMVDPFEDC